MKLQLPLLTLLLVVIALPTGWAQTRSAKAPPRRPAAATKPATVVKPPTVAKSPTSTKPTTKPGSTIVPAQNRSNSTALPASTPTAPPKPTPPPARPQPRPVATRPPVRTYEREDRGLAYGKGDNLLNVGVGLSSYYYGNPLGISFELGVDKDISVGAQFDYNSGYYGDNYYNSSRWRYTSTYVGARGSYHFNRILRLNTRKLDLYAGLGLGYRTFRWGDSNYGYGYDYSSGLFVNYFIGGKYYFNDKFGAFLELGYTGLSSSRIGLSAKF